MSLIRLLRCDRCGREMVVAPGIGYVWDVGWAELKWQEDGATARLEVCEACLNDLRVEAGDHRKFPAGNAFPGVTR